MKLQCDLQVWLHWPVALSGLVNAIMCSARQCHDVIRYITFVMSQAGMRVTCWGRGSGGLLGDCSKETVLLVILEVNGYVQPPPETYLWFLSLVRSIKGLSVYLFLGER